MIISNRDIQVSNKTFHLDSKKLSIKSAVVGSVIFAILDLVAIFINSYFLKIETTFDVIAVTAIVGWFIFVILFGSATTYFPASYLGTFFARILEKDFDKNQLSQKSAIMKGALFGAIAVLLVCIPLLFLDFVFVLSTGHGDFFVMIYRAGIATMIASFAGAWTGNKLVKQLIR